MTETAAAAEPLLLRWDRTERFKHREIIGGLLAMHSYSAGHGGTIYGLWSQLENVLPDGEICESEWIALVFEVISPETRDFDYGIKVDVYARAEIAEYVIFDPYTRVATRYAQPKDGEYRLRQVVHYGEPVELELPYPIVIETADLSVDPNS